MKVIDTFQMPDDSFVSLPKVTIQKKHEPRMTKRGVITEIVLADDTDIVILCVEQQNCRNIEGIVLLRVCHVKIHSYMDIKFLM